MMSPLRPVFLGLAAALCLAVSALADEVAPSGPVLLTVSGAVTKPNRGPVDPDYDKLLTFNEVDFDKARAFDAAALNALPQATVQTDFPKGGGIVTFTGPLLADVLAAAGAAGEKITIQAMDGYAVEIPAKDMLGNGAVVALARDGRPFGIGDFGPTQIVFPRTDRPALKDMPDDWWIWEIFHIKVE